MMRVIQIPRANALEDQVARDFEDEVTDEEHARGEAVGAVGDSGVGEHLQLGHRDVGAIEVVDDEEQAEERA